MGWSDWRKRIRSTTGSNTTSSGYSYSPATSAGRSTVSSGYSQNTPGINQTAADEYWGVPEGWRYGSGEGYNAYRAERGYTPYTNSYASSASAGSGGGGGGYGYGGGGGGGGGGGALTQAMLDQMLAVLGMHGSPLALQQANLPAFQGMNLPAFNAAPYTQATNQLNAAQAADIAAAQRAGTQATQALQANYANAYANTPVAQAPAAEQVGVALQGTVGGGGDQAAVAAQTDAAGASDQASFQNLLGVLAAADQTAQNSRLNQVALDQGTALNSINAQQRGLLGGIGMARTQAQNQWAQAQAERQYQNSLMAQQWQREALMRNQDLTNQTSTANWTQQNEMINNRLTPLLQLLGQGGTGLDLSGIQALIAALQQ